MLVKCGAALTMIHSRRRRNTFSILEAVPISIGKTAWLRPAAENLDVAGQLRSAALGKFVTGVTVAATMDSDPAARIDHQLVHVRLARPAADPYLHRQERGELRKVLHVRRLQRQCAEEGQRHISDLFASSRG